MNLNAQFFVKSIKVFVIIIMSFCIGVIPANANNTSAVLPFSQNWTDASLITVSDDWSGVPSIIGYRGDGLTAAIDADPQTILAGDDAAPVVDVNANQTNPSSYTTGGVAEFGSITDPTIALNGSATADAPYIKLFFNTTGLNNIRVSYNVRDLDGSVDNAVQQVALHYRIGSSGNFTNVPAAYIADATTGPNLATLVTAVNVLLPVAVNDKTLVELRIMTTNANGNDEWVGIDDISITANYPPTGFSLTPNSVLENQPSGTFVGSFAAVDANGSDTHTFTLVNSLTCAGNGADNSNFSITGSSLKTSTIFDRETKSSYEICVQVTDNNGLSFIGAYTVNVDDIADESGPTVVSSDPAHNSVLLTGPTQITVEFNEDVKSDAGSGAANNTANYLLVKGTNGLFSSASCSGGRLPDDIKITINSSAYDNNGGSGSFIATLNINNGVKLSPGDYRLFVCGTTSIEDLTGNELNDGVDTVIDFTVSQVANALNGNSDAELPSTGFPLGEVTRLPIQPDEKAYGSYSDLWLEIPNLAVATSIVGVPLTDDGWDVTWLGKDVGWLNGTAFPTWSGNSVITGHVWDAYNQPGVFYKLKSLSYGDYIKVHAFGQVYIYEVRQTQRIATDNFAAALQHEEKAWLTLITCEDYRFLFKTYNFRRMVRAVLVSVVDE